MKAQLEKFIRTKVKNPREEEIREILGIFEERTYSKGQVFKEANTISKELGFIISGSLRLFLCKENGDEITGQVNFANRFITDLISVRSSQETPITIDCLEVSELLIAPTTKVRELLDTNLALNILMREHIAERSVEVGKRLILFLTGTGKERYQYMLKNDPKIKRFPLRLIASMIGITPTQLSRIRKEK